MPFASDGNSLPWENEWSEPLLPTTSQEEVQGSKSSRFKSQTTQKERGFYRNKPSVTAIVGGCLVPMWINRSVVSALHIHLKHSFSANFTSKEKKKKKMKKKNNKMTPTDYRSDDNVPVFIAANAILIKLKLLRSLSNKYFSTILIFS